MQVHTSVSGTARSQRGVTKANAARSRSLLHVTAAQAHRRERNPAEKREEATQVQRREATGAVLASVAGVAHVGPADAALGLGGKSKQQKYYDETYDIINQVEYTLSLDKDDPNKDDAVGQTRKMTNQWVAKWRREKDFSGRPSFSNVYSSLNAVSGHYNNFGTRYPLPKRRRDRVVQELDDAKRYLERNR